HVGGGTGAAGRGRAQRGDEVQAGAVAVVGALGEGLGEDGVGLRGEVGPVGGQAGRIVVLVGPQQRHVVVAAEGRMPGERLVDDTGEAVHVAAGVDGAAGDLLGRDVVEGADELADGGEAGQ